MDKNHVLDRIEGHIFSKSRLGPENRLAGSADFLHPNFQKSRFYPPPDLPPYIPHIVIVRLSLLLSLYISSRQQKPILPGTAATAAD